MKTVHIITKLTITKLILLVCLCLFLIYQFGYAIGKFYAIIENFKAQ